MQTYSINLINNNIKIKAMNNNTTQLKQMEQLLVIPTSGTNVILNIELLTNELKRNKIKVAGELNKLHSFKDGSVLVADNVNGKNVKFYKVNNSRIKMGKFIKGKFHYSLVNTLVTSNVGYIPELVTQRIDLSKFNFVRGNKKRVLEFS